MQNSLKKNKDFSYIYKKGQKVNSDNFTLFVVESKYNNYRIGFSISKKLGKANIRNKLKRRLREIVRKDVDVVKFHNYVLMCHEGAQNLDFKNLRSEVIYLFDKFKNKLKKD